MNIDNIIKNLQQQIKSIKESNKNEMNNEILQIKKKYADKTLAETKNLKLELKKARYKKFYNETYGIVEMQPTKRDIVAMELFKKAYFQCSIEEKKNVQTQLTREYRAERKIKGD